MTQGGPSDHFKRSAGNPWEKRLWTLSPTPILRAEREAGDWVQSPVASGFMNHTHAMKPQQHLLNNRLSRAFWVGDHVSGGWHTLTPWGQKLLCLGPFRTLPYTPLHLVIGLHPLYNKLLCVGLSWVMWVTREWLNLSKGHGTLMVVFSQEEMQVTWGFHLWLVSEVGEVLWDSILNLWGLW